MVGLIELVVCGSLGDAPEAYRPNLPDLAFDWPGHHRSWLQNTTRSI
jgi:hypothetical protein